MKAAARASIRDGSRIDRVSRTKRIKPERVVLAGKKVPAIKNVVIVQPLRKPAKPPNAKGGKRDIERYLARIAER